jgi:hypothetical protein
MTKRELLMPYQGFWSRKGASDANLYVPIVGQSIFMVDKIGVFRKYG